MKQEDLAGTLGITQSSVSGWINGRYEPAAATVFTIEQSLDLEPGALSRPLGYLPVEPAARGVSVEAAIAQDAQLDDEEKAALVAMYRLLVKRSADRPRNRRVPAAPSTPRSRSVSGGR